MLAAILLASSFVSNLAAARRLGSRREQAHYLEQSLTSPESMDINSLASLESGSTSSNPSINLEYSGPSLAASASICLVSVSTSWYRSFAPPPRPDRRDYLNRNRPVPLLY